MGLLTCFLEGSALSTFGQQNVGPVPTTGTQNPPYQITSEKEPGANYATNFQAITMMAPYQKASFEVYTLLQSVSNVNRNSVSQTTHKIDDSRRPVHSASLRHLAERHQAPRVLSAVLEVRVLRRREDLARQVNNLRPLSVRAPLALRRVRAGRVRLVPLPRGRRGHLDRLRRNRLRSEPELQEHLGGLPRAGHLALEHLRSGRILGLVHLDRNLRLGPGSVEVRLDQARVPQPPAAPLLQRGRRSRLPQAHPHSARLQLPRRAQVDGKVLVPVRQVPAHPEHSEPAHKITSLSLADLEEGPVLLRLRLRQEVRLGDSVNLVGQQVPLADSVVALDPGHSDRPRRLLARGFLGGLPRRRLLQPGQDLEDSAPVQERLGHLEALALDFSEVNRPQRHHSASVVRR